MSIMIKLRRGNKSEWDSNSNIVLASGEPGYELDTGQFKIGNGLTAWSGLSYASIIPTGFLAGTGINLQLGPNGQYLTINASGGAIISNYGNNRLLTSDGTTTGINGENNLTFDGSLLAISGNLVANTGTINSLNFNDIGDPDLSIRQLAWNNSEGSLAVGLSDTYEMFLGGELHYRVRNNTGSSILAGTAVYATGLTPGGNNRIEIAPKAADGSIREVRFMGLVTENIDNGVNGFTTHFGYIRNIDTRGDYAANGATNKVWASGEPVWAEGDLLYVHPTVAGKLTKIEPKHSISVAIILNRHQNQGKLFVRPTSYGHLNDNHDVAVSGATNGQFLQYNSVTDYWVPSSSGNFTSLSVNGTGVSVSGHTHTASQITDFNEAVDDRIVSGLFVAGTGINLNYNDVSNSFTVSVTGLINNPANNRILTSRDSTTTGIDAESNLTFNGSTLSVSGLINASSGNFINSLQFNGINYLDTTTYILARPGDNLITKYNEAKTLTPRGSTKSATNRASLIVMPGTYPLSAELTVDTQFVDIIGLGSQTKKPAVLLTTNTINVTANDVRVQGISVGDQNFKIADNKSLQIIENCVGDSMFSFGGNDITVGGTPLTISGTFIGCSSSGMWSFGGANTVSGRFIDCEGGQSSFGGSGGIVSGYFERCVGGNNSFGGGGLVSGTFLYCIGGSTSFGGGGDGPAFGPHTDTPQASGVFKYCSAGNGSFGGGTLSAGIASGIFLYCNASDGSFGGFGSGSLANGTFKYCTGALRCFCSGAGSIASGYFEYCTGGNGSFAGVDGASGDTTGTFNHCIAGNNSFGYNINGFYNNCIAGNDSFKFYIGGILNYCKAGTNSFAAELGGAISGVLNNCVGGNNSFNYSTPITITGKLHNCIVSSGTFATPTSGGKLINCIDGDGNVITIT